MQGVGFRYFVQQHAERLGIKGWVRNLDDGGVEVYALAAAALQADLAGLLRQGPRWSEVRRLEESEAVPTACDGFRIRS